MHQQNNRGLEIAHTGHRPIKGLELRYKSPGNQAANILRNPLLCTGKEELARGT